MIKALKTLCFLFIGFGALAQSQIDTSMIVNGVCGMCEATIETAANLKGVSYAEWDRKTLKLSLKYYPDSVNLAQINEAIVQSGYDTEFQTASDSAYFKLAPCCYYRDPNNVHKHQEEPKEH